VPHAIALPAAPVPQGSAALAGDWADEACGGGARSELHVRRNYLVSTAAVERLHDTAGGHLRALEVAGRWLRSSSVSYTCLQWIDTVVADSHRFELQQKLSIENLVFMFILFLIDLNCFKKATKVHTKMLVMLDHKCIYLLNSL